MSYINVYSLSMMKDHKLDADRPLLIAHRVLVQPFAQSEVCLRLVLQCEADLTITRVYVCRQHNEGGSYSEMNQIIRPLMGQTIRDIKITNQAFLSVHNTIQCDDVYRNRETSGDVSVIVRGKLPICASNFVVICFPPDIQDMVKQFLKAESCLIFLCYLNKV